MIDPEEPLLSDIQTMDYAIFLTDNDGRVVGWHSSAERLFGYAEEEVIGAHLSEFFTDQAVERGVPTKMLLAGRCERDGWLFRKGDCRFWASGFASALMDEEGNVVGHAVVMRHASDQREIQALMRHFSGVGVQGIGLTKLRLYGLTAPMLRWASTVIGCEVQSVQES